MKICRMAQNVPSKNKPSEAQMPPAFNPISALVDAWKSEVNFFRCGLQYSIALSLAALNKYEYASYYNDLGPRNFKSDFNHCGTA
jgi:hypothetical protein